MLKGSKSRQYPLRDTPELMKILLKDRTTKKNIKWATDDYADFGFNVTPKTEIDFRWLTNDLRNIVQPRVKKNIETQKERTKDKAEVFTPTWIVEKQVNYVDEEFKDLPLEDYINKTWLEITCGEAPYICTRYDSTTGEPLSLEHRVGFLDKKLNRISKEINDKDTWLKLVKTAYETTYGYEYQGDSLIIARENLLFTFIDYYIDKFDEEPSMKDLKTFATIISYNLFQMDGLKYTTPYSGKVVPEQEVQMDLFSDIELFDENPQIAVQEENAKFIFRNNRLIEFKEILKAGNNMKFDVIIGNPPYQGVGRQQIYTDFYVSSREIGEISCMIFPTGWHGPKNANNLKKMNNDEIKKDKQIVKIIKLRDVFLNVPGASSLNILIWKRGFDNKLNGKQRVIEENGKVNITVLPIKKEEIPKPRFIREMAEKVSKRNDFISFQTIVSKRKPYGLRTDVINNHKKCNLPSFQDEQIKKTDIRVFTSRGFKYVPIDYPFPQKSVAFNKFKVFVPYAWGNWREETGFGGAYSDIFVAQPQDACIETYLECGAFSNLSEAENLAKYMMTKFFRALLYANKYSQHSTTAFGAIPTQNFTESWWDGSIEEIDSNLFHKYGISQEIFNSVNSNIQTKNKDNIVFL